MSDDKLLQQDEVDALLRAAASGGTGQDSTTATSAGDGPAGVAAGQPKASGEGDQVSTLTPREVDALGEIGNISMGSAATTLSQLLDKKVLITSPTVTLSGKKDFLNRFNVPFLVIKVKFKEGFYGYNVLIIKLTDAIVMANLMMGGDGTELPDEISDMEISAAAEAMNQMIGTASTSLADLLSRNINIMPPEVDVVSETDKVDINLPFDDPIVVISFHMSIEGLLDTSIMQVIDLHTAREQTELLWNKYSSAGEGAEPAPLDEQVTGTVEPVDHGTGMVMEKEPQPFTVNERARREPTPGYDIRYDQEAISAPPYRPAEVPQIDPDKLSLLLDIPLKVTVVLGRTKKQIKDVLQMTPGAIVEMETLVGDPVEILVNGKLVAKGEVVVVNENFGVKLTSIISTRERLNTLNSENMMD